MGLVRPAVRRPAGVADADRAGQRRALEQRREVDELALGAAPLDMAVGQRRDAGRVVAAIFQPPEAVEQQRRRRRLAQNADDAAHLSLPRGTAPPGPQQERCQASLRARPRPALAAGGCRPRRQRPVC